MSLALLVVVSLSTSTLSPAPAQEPNTIRLADTVEGRKATLLGGVELDATWKPSQSPPLRLIDGLRFASEGTPAPLDHGGGSSGGGISSGGRQVLALLLGLLVGFGTGHLVAKNREGFILFLIVDIVIIVASNVLELVVLRGGGLLWGIGGLALLISHIIQGLDAYALSGGERLIEVTREKAVRLARAGSGLEAPIITTRSFGFEF
jgi:hypothetical protein